MFKRFYSTVDRDAARFLNTINATIRVNIEIGRPIIKGSTLAQGNVAKESFPNKARHKPTFTEVDVWIKNAHRLQAMAPTTILHLAADALGLS